MFFQSKLNIYNHRINARGGRKFADFGWTVLFGQKGKNKIAGADNTTLAEV